METRLIGLYSPRSRSGKSTVASRLEDLAWENGEAFTTISLADPLRQAAMPIIRPFFATEAEAWAALTTDAKDRVIPGLGVSGRRILQTLGTDWGRDIIHKELWIMIARFRIRAALDSGEVVVVDDVRFEDEYDLILELGGKVVQVIRPDAPETEAHASNGRLDDKPFHATLMNTHTVRTLKHHVDALALTLLRWFPG